MTSYFKTTRTLSYSLLFALPLLFLYEAGAIYIAEGDRSQLRNGADVLLRTVLAGIGVEGTAALAVGLTALGFVLIAIERRKRKVPLKVATFAMMALESATYAVLLGAIVGGATQRLLEFLAIQAGALTALPASDAIVLSLGAGFYEELAFRVLLVGGIFAAFRGGGATPVQAGGFAVVLASLLFSAFHYIGPYGDPWALPSFLFRFLAGLAFSLLFLLRGFGVTAWTHALYDIFLVLALSA